MPEGFGYGGDEVSSTTNKKAITKKAVPQKTYGTKNPPIHPETPTPTGIPLMPKGRSPEAIAEFQRQVVENVSDPATQRDIFKAANVPMPGHGLSSKAMRAGELQRAGPAGKESRRKEDAMKAGGFTRAEVGAFKQLEGERLLRKRKKKEPVYETEQPGP